MKTAQEVYNEATTALIALGTQYSVTSLMIAFAKMHVEAALKAAVENVEVLCDSSGTFQSLDENSILNAYNSDLIK